MFKHTRFILVVELIRRYDDKTPIFDIRQNWRRPPMTPAVTIAKHILTFTAFVIFKVLFKESGSATTSPTGKILEGDIDRYRITLGNCPTKNHPHPDKILFIRFDYSRSELMLGQQDFHHSTILTESWDEHFESKSRKIEGFADDWRRKRSHSHH